MAESTSNTAVRLLAVVRSMVTINVSTVIAAIVVTAANFPRACRIQRERLPLCADAELLGDVRGSHRGK